MQLMSLRCPNCNGPLKMVNEGTFYCANCDSSFMADYDKDDVEYQKMKTEAEIRKQQLDQAQSVQAERAQAAKSVFRRKMIALAIVMTVVLTIIVPTVIGTLRAQKRVAEERRQQEIEREAKREQEQKEKEEKRRQEEEARLAKEEAERQAKLASYRLSPEEITADDFFVDNANKALEGQIRDNTDPFWDYWAMNEDPKYITSYLLIAKDENKRVQNMLCSVYEVHWDKELDDHTEQYVMYDGACITNISRNDDGTIKSDYDPDSISYHSELIGNQFLSGYTEYDQLIRQEIYGNADYDYIEFKMPGYEDIEE